MKTKITLAALAAAAIVPASAGAHVTLQPSEAPAGSFTRLDVRVPNERDDSGTVKVDVQFPEGFYTASYEPVPGWTVKVDREPLPEPVEIEPGFEVSDQVTRITWTGDGKTGLIPPGAFQDFGLSLRTPDEPGTALTFKALQTYESGEVVRWIGEPDSDEPAPQVTLTDAEAEHGAAPEDDDAAESEDDEDSDSDGLAIAGLAVGGLGLAAGGTALARSRRNGTA